MFGLGKKEEMNNDDLINEINKIKDKLDFISSKIESLELSTNQIVKRINKNTNDVNLSNKNLLNRISHALNLIKRLEQKDKHNNKMISIICNNVKKLSKLHHYSRYVVTTVRNTISPISKEKRMDLINKIKNIAKK